MGNDGNPKPNDCGKNGLPEFGSNSNSLALAALRMDPRGFGSYAKDNEFSRNAYTFYGTYYYIYAKLAECHAATGCFKRSKDIDFTFGRVQSKQSDSPNTFYFGQLGDDIDACEAACKNDRDCLAYTFYQGDYADPAFAGGCYGVGKAEESEGVRVEGVYSGKSMNCDSFIPDYMVDDMWTRNVTGCPCQFDTTRRDCACCYDRACQCGYKHKYQCSLCGFSDRCGYPFLTTNSHEYIFEYDDQMLNDDGRHYQIPEMCVTGCTMTVRGSGASGAQVEAHMTTSTDRRALSCVASGLNLADNVNVRVSASPINLEAVRVNKINLYSYGGQGKMVQLKLKVDKEACATTSSFVDHRYVGCFKLDRDYYLSNNYTRDHPRLTSTRMTKAICMNHCHKYSYNFALLRNGIYCECSQSLPTTGEASNCDMFCAGEPSEVCGGTNAQSVYMTVTNGLYTETAAVAVGGCDGIGGNRLGTVSLSSIDSDCAKFGTTQTANQEGACDFDICSVSQVSRGGLYPAAPGSCGNDKKGAIKLRTTGADCLSLGGNPSFGQTSWGQCQLDLCQADSSRDTLYSVIQDFLCPSHRRIGKLEYKMEAGRCRELRGQLYEKEIPDANVTLCTGFVACSTQKETQESEYTFPNKNEVVLVGGHDFSVPEMCVTECTFKYQASSENVSVATATMIDDSGNAGLICGGQVENKEEKESLTFASKATGVKVKSITFVAQKSPYIVKSLKLRVETNGCKDDEDMIVLYDQPNFGGKPAVIKSEVADLSSIDFNNKASSFKIYGNQMWELFESKDYKGSSAVLGAGSYYDTNLLPFGNNQLSSVHPVASLNTNMDQTRKAISNTRDLVCFRRVVKSNAVFGLPPNGAGSEDRPRIFYFGEMGYNLDACERACRNEPQCAAFTLFSPEAEDEALRSYRGQCYGRSFRDEVDTYQEDVISGYVANCAQEDTITLYSEKAFTGVRIMIIEDAVNITMASGASSVIVTGQDTWRVLTMSEGHVHTYNLSPGDYSDVSTNFVGEIFQVYKMHPNTQLYKAQHNTIDLAPVALNQIERTVTKIKTRITGGTNTTQEDCSTTQLAEIFFVIDASSSIRDYNYVKVLDFVNNIIDSFDIGDDKVRVGVIIFSSYSHLDITLGQYNTKEKLKSKVSSLTYYKGRTWTHEAIMDLRNKGLLDEVVRDDVSKQAIVITDGASRYPDYTADECHLCRDAGVTMTAIGIGAAVYTELQDIAGDASRVFNVTGFDDLDLIVGNIDKTTCKAVNTGKILYNETEHVSITVQGNDTNYFVWEHPEFNRKPVALGMESGVILNVQIFASSSLHGFEAEFGRLNHQSGWMTTIGNHTNHNEWIEVDLGQILPIHGVATQGHAYMESWVTKYYIAISLDGIHFVTLKDSNTSVALTFIGNVDQNTINYHCLHRLFGTEIQARVIRFIAVEWHLNISMRIELYGFREPGDDNVIEVLRKDVWTRNVTGCPCYFKPSSKDCACCEDGGCQCPNGDRHQCVQCGYPHNCGTPSLRNPINNIDGWTRTMSGCRCHFDRSRTDCACCQSWGCQCGAANKNQCVNCGHPEHCGLKEHIFGPNNYCKPQTCPRKINTIWENAPTGIAPGDSNPQFMEVNSTDVKSAATVL